MSVNSDYISAIKGLLEELRTITIMAMADAGIKENSDVSKSVKYVLTSDGIQMRVAEYYGWLDTGHEVKRRAMVQRIPLDVLIQWIKKKGIVGRNKKSGRFITTNQLAFAIQTSIYKNGIKSKIKTKGKKFAQNIADNIADYTSEQLAESLAIQIADDIEDMFAPISIK